LANERIVVLDDQEIMRESLTASLTASGYKVFPFDKGEDALEFIQTKSVDLVLTDMKMPKITGIEVLEKIKSFDEMIPVILITAYGTIETAVDAMKKGAEDYIIKPVKLDELEIVVRKALKNRKIKQENVYLKSEMESQFNRYELVGEHQSLKDIMTIIKKVAGTDSTILVKGESGTGKELVARAVHQNSTRKGFPFVRVNCAALSAGLLESELFGHERGAFTGADKQRVGRFELANGGTILLDEISEIDLNLQAKLLRVLQEKEFERVGSNDVITVDVRVIATTNRSLEDCVDKGEFREDLFYRLNVIPISVAPLRERKDDIRILTNAFVKQFGIDRGFSSIMINDSGFKALMEYTWPGNVRELQNLVERLATLYPGETIGDDVVKMSLGKRKNSSQSSVFDVGHSMAEVEKEYILRTLESLGLNRIKTAEILGIGERTLREKLKKWKDAGEIDI
jgi:DNA-binding NtrC family response regulator